MTDNNIILTASEIKERLRIMSWHGIFIDEFTCGDKRIDVAIIDTRHRWVRGFEIKTNRQDYLNDYKWTTYTQFLSSLSIVCPEGLIEPKEVYRPFGLLWVGQGRMTWKKRPCNFQERRTLAWLWTYVSLLEIEVPRMKMEIISLRYQLEEAGRKNGQKS